MNYRSFHWRVAEARANGDWDLQRVSIGFFRMPKSDEWCVNTSRLMGVDSTDNESLTKAEMEGRKQVEEIFRFLKKYVPGCENAQLTASGSYVGIRESRHIRGEYRLTADDLLDAKVPEDSILVASNSVDVHGRFGPTSNEYIPIKGDYYGVPYRSLVPVGVDGLLLAGRCVSADSTAAGAIRVMPPSMAMGQAAGCAAAQAVRTGVEPRNIDIAALQRTLRAAHTCRTSGKNCSGLLDRSKTVNYRKISCKILKNRRKHHEKDACARACNPDGSIPAVRLQQDPCGHHHDPQHH